LQTIEAEIVADNEQDALELLKKYCEEDERADYDDEAYEWVLEDESELRIER
jgi:hypothetical protein